MTWTAPIYFGGSGGGTTLVAGALSVEIASSLGAMLELNSYDLEIAEALGVSVSSQDISLAITNPIVVNLSDPALLAEIGEE